MTTGRVRYGHRCHCMPLALLYRTTITSLSMWRMLPTGDERPGATPADLVFIIEEKPHQKFSREGNDLVYNARLPLVDALCGATVHLTTLDGRPLTVRSPLLWLVACKLARLQGSREVVPLCVHLKRR